MDSTKITVTNMRIIVEDQKEDSPGADGMWHVLGLLQAVCGVLLRGLLRHQDDPEPGAGAQPGASRDVQGAPLAASREVPLKRRLLVSVLLEGPTRGLHVSMRATSRLGDCMSSC